MKKLSVFIALAFLSLTASAQTRIGVDGGLNISYMTGFSNMGFATAPFAGGTLGVYNETKITDFLGFRAGVAYSQQGITTAFTNNDYEWIMSSYIIVPVFLTFSLADDRFLLGVGPQLGIACSMKDRWRVYDPLTRTSWWDTYNFKAGEQYNVCDCSIDVLARFLISDNFGIKLQYNFGVTDVFNNMNIVDKKKYVDNGINSNFVGQIGVFFLFDEL